MFNKTQCKLLIDEYMAKYNITGVPTLIDAAAGAAKTKVSGMGAKRKNYKGQTSL